MKFTVLHKIRHGYVPKGPDGKPVLEIQSDGAMVPKIEIVELAADPGVIHDTDGDLKGKFTLADAEAALKTRAPSIKVVVEAPKPPDPPKQSDQKKVL